MNKLTQLEVSKVYKQSKLSRITAVISLLFLLNGGVTLADSLAVTNTFAPNTPATAASVNRNFTDVENSVNDNHSRITGLEDRLIPVEAAINGQLVPVNCSAVPTALKDLTLTPNTTYVLTGICDGQIRVGAGLGTINIEGDGIGVQDDGITLPAGETDINTVFAAIYAIDGVSLNLTRLVINAANYNSQGDLYIAGVGSYFGAHVRLNTVDVVGGDEGIGAYNTGTFSLRDNISVTGFGSSGLMSNGASLIRVWAGATVTGGTGQDWSGSSAVAAYNGGVVRFSGGGTITPASGPLISLAADTAAAIDAFRNGTIDVRNATINGTVWSGESSAVNLKNVTQSDGNIDSYRNSVIRVRSSNVTGTAGDAIFAGVFSTIRMDDTTIGNASGTGTINLYSYGVIDLRVLSGIMDMNFRGINCSDPRSVRLIGAVSNQGSISCIP